MPSIVYQPHEQTRHQTVTDQLADDFTCRICLEEDKFGIGMIRPCRCIGHFHKSCLQQWMDYRLKKKNFQYLRCQICKCQYQVKTGQKIAINCQYFSQVWQNNPNEIILKLIIITIIISILISILFLIGQISNNTNFSKIIQDKIKVQSATIILVLSILNVGIFIIAIFLIFKFCKTYFIQNKFMIDCK